MHVDKRTLAVGQKLIVQITGSVGNHEAVVTGHDERYGEAILKVTDDPSWEQFPLKREDYIVVEIVGEETE